MAVLSAEPARGVACLRGLGIRDFAAALLRVSAILNEPALFLRFYVVGFYETISLVQGGFRTDLYEKKGGKAKIRYT